MSIQVIDYIIQTYTCNISKLDFYMFGNIFNKCIHVETYSVIYNKLKQLPLHESNHMMKYMFGDLIHHFKTPIHPVFQNIYNHFKNTLLLTLHFIKVFGM